MSIKIFCDIADLKLIKEYNKKKIVEGFTTNPSLMRKAGAKSYEDYSKQILKICSMQNNCKVSDRSSDLANELTKKILTKAAFYEKENKIKKKNPKYKNEALRTDQ